MPLLQSEINKTNFIGLGGKRRMKNNLVDLNNHLFGQKVQIDEES